MNLNANITANTKLLKVICGKIFAIGKNYTKFTCRSIRLSNSIFYKNKDLTSSVTVLFRNNVFFSGFSYSSIFLLFDGNQGSSETMEKILMQILNDNKNYVD